MSSPNNIKEQFDKLRDDQYRKNSREAVDKASLIDLLTALLKKLSESYRSFNSLIQIIKSEILIPMQIPDYNSLIEDVAKGLKGFYDPIDFE